MPLLTSVLFCMYLVLNLKEISRGEIIKIKTAKLLARTNVRLTTVDVSVGTLQHPDSSGAC